MSTATPSDSELDLQLKELLARCATHAIGFAGFAVHGSVYAENFPWSTE